MPSSAPEKDKFRILFDHASDAHIIFDAGGISDCNDAMVRLLEAKDKSEILKSHPSRLSPEFQPDGRRSDEKAKEMDSLARARGYHRFEWLHRKFSGAVFPVEVTLNPVEIEGRPAMIAVWHDLTERKNAEEMLNRELSAAAAIQNSLLPKLTPYHPRVHTSWVFKPHGYLAGDLLNVFTVDPDHLAFYVLDVAGHGVASSLLSVTVSHLLNLFSRYDRSSGLPCAEKGTVCLSPAEICTRLNQHFADDHIAVPGMFFTLFYGILNLKTLRLKFVCAGHPGPLLLSRSGSLQEISHNSLPVGIIKNAEYSEKTITLEAGDRFIVFSDGLVEARNAAGEFWGMKPVESHLRSSVQERLEHSLSGLLEALKDWCLPGVPADDVSILAVEIKS